MERTERWVVWDWNGTLLDDAAICVRVMNGMLRERSLPSIAHMDQYRRLFCFPVRAYYDKLGFDYEAESFETLAQVYMDRYTAESRQAALAHGAAEALARLAAAGVRQLLLSASERGNLLDQVSRFHLGGRFDGILGLDDHYAVSKADLARRWLASTGLSSGQAVFIGDTTHDFQVAQALDCRCILVLGGHQGRAALSATGAPVVESLEAAADLALSLVHGD